MNPYLQIKEEDEARGIKPLEAAMPPPKPVEPRGSDNPYMEMKRQDLRAAQGVPSVADEPQGVLDTAYQVGHMASEYAQGAVHGIMEGWEDMARGLGGGTPEDQLAAEASISEKIAQIPRFAINMITGGKGVTEALRGAEMTDYASPLAGKQREMPEGSAPVVTNEPTTPMEQLGAATSAVPEILMGGGAMKGVRALGEMREIRNAVKQITKGSEKQLEAVPEMLRSKARPDGLPPGMTDEKAKALLDAVEDSRELATTKVLDSFMEAAAKGSIGSYRTRLVKLFDGINDPTLMPKSVQDKLLGWENGMTAKEFMRWRKMVTNRSKRPDSKFYVETPAAKQKRRMYSEIADAMDEHLDQVLPPEGVMKQWGEGMQMYKVLRRWDEAKRIFTKGLDWRDGERIFNSNKILKELSKLDDRKVREIFGADMSKATRILKASAKSTAAARRNAEKKAHTQFWKIASAMGIGSAVGTALLGRTGPIQSGVRELLGGSREIGHQGQGR